MRKIWFLIGFVLCTLVWSGNSLAQEKLKLTFGTSPHPYAFVHHYALEKGIIKAKDLEIHIEYSFPGQRHKVLMAGVLDAGSMETSSYFLALDKKIPLKAIAVDYTQVADRTPASNRMFVLSGINSPKELEGKKVGVHDMASISIVTHRALLKDKFGVNTDKITWVAKDIPFLFQLLKAGEIQGAVLFSEFGLRAEQEPGLKTLYWFAETWKEFTGMEPVNMLVVAKEEHVIKHPQGLRTMLALLRQSFAYGEEHKGELIDKVASERGLDRELIKRSFGSVTLYYTLAQWHKKAVQISVNYAYEQGLIKKKWNVDDIFAQVIETTP